MTTTRPPHTTSREVLLTEIERRGLTQAELARISGVAQPALSAWLQGTRKLREDNLDRLIRALGFRLTRR